MLNEYKNAVYDRINRLKHEKDVRIFSHYSVSPGLKVPSGEGGFADFTGDSMELAIEAQRTSAQNIIVCGLRFMAENVLLLNPEKRIFMPQAQSCCSLASAITAADI